MESKREYQNHLYEPVRLQIAKDYFKREYRKRLPDLRGEEIWSRIDGEIDDWLEADSGVGILRDFWNGFWGDAMGFKLKIGFIQVLTAENVKWQIVPNLALDCNLASGGPLTYIDPRLSERRPKADRLREFFADPANSALAQKWLEEFKRHGRMSEERDNFPIIVMEEIDDRETIFSVYDGNRRLVLAVLEGKTEIPAYVGKYQAGERKPKNFWLPTPFLMELVKEAELIGTWEAGKGIEDLLKSFIDLSEVAKFELFDRVLVGDNEFRKRLKENLQNEN